MTTKYNTRFMPHISRDNGSFDRGEKEPSWFGDFVANIEQIEKNSVKSKRDDLSTFDEINRILGNKSKYSSVEEAVLDMQKRSGLYDYIKQAQIAAIQDPDIFTQIPVLKSYIDNYIADRPGATVFSVIHDLMKIKPIKDKLPEGDDVPKEVYDYISKKIGDAAVNKPVNDAEDMNLGKLDNNIDDNTTKDNDPFSGCNPNRDTH
jgi:hypothetical protein